MRGLAVDAFFECQIVAALAVPFVLDGLHQYTTEIRRMAVAASEGDLFAAGPL